jgi:hypothetical protein
VLITLENNNLLDTLTVENLIEIESEQFTEQLIKQFTRQLPISSLTSSERSLFENISETL